MYVSISDINVKAMAHPLPTPYHHQQEENQKYSYFFIPEGEWRQRELASIQRRLAR